MRFVERLADVYESSSLINDPANASSIPRAALRYGRETGKDDFEGKTQGFGGTPSLWALSGYAGAYS
jgi:hypothetical protein